MQALALAGRECVELQAGEAGVCTVHLGLYSGLGFGFHECPHATFPFSLPFFILPHPLLLLNIAFYPTSLLHHSVEAERFSLPFPFPLPLSGLRPRSRSSVSFSDLRSVPRCSLLAIPMLARTIPTSA